MEAGAKRLETGHVARAVRTGGLHPLGWREPAKGLGPLWELALDLRWTWSHASDRFWQVIDEKTWKATSNPWLILQTISRRRLDELTADPGVRQQVQEVAAERAEYLRRPGWFQLAYPQSPLRRVAYFSMEFGLGEALPLYAGGLGVLAGDFLKTASDIALPTVGVGLLYREGYFRQVIEPEAGQIEFYPQNDSSDLPITPVRDAEDGWLRVALELPGRVALLRVWRAVVGRVDLYLLDSNDPLNAPADRGITSKLYDAESDERLLQELALGIGGWRALDAMGLAVDVCHLNEGHAAFAILERAAGFMRRSGCSFAEALWAARAGNVFTTHTPVAAAFDVFPAPTMARHFRDYAGGLGIPLEDLLALGRRDPADGREPFNMAFLALRGSGWVNGVSRLHGEVSRGLFAPLFGRWPRREVPVSHITNGVHAPSWDSEPADALWTRLCGKGRWLFGGEDLCETIRRTSDTELWTMRNKSRAHLVEYARERLARQLTRRGVDHEVMARVAGILDPEVLTLGFARRFTAYKRPSLLLSDPARLEAILCNEARKVQLVVAGKAHPRDAEGKQMVREFVEFAGRPALSRRVVFLDDYDLDMAQHLVQGVDVWINTPRHPWEACGTSGMKVLVNGGLNLSELDGWWAEAYRPEVGWALGEDGHGEASRSDAEDARELYDILENKVIPEFYDRDREGLPRDWLARIRASMAELTARFGSNRMVREYVENVYLEAAAGVERRALNAGALARELNAWQKTLERNWPDIHFGSLGVATEGERHHFRVEVYLGALSPDLVAVELYAEESARNPAIRLPMERVASVAGGADGYLYEALVSAARPADDYTPRVVPRHKEARVPLEESRILWFR